MTPPNGPPSGTIPRPTHVRYSVLGLLCLLAMITYLDRAMYGSAKADLMASVGASPAHGRIDARQLGAADRLRRARLAAGAVGVRRGGRGLVCAVLVLVPQRSGRAPRDERAGAGGHQRGQGADDGAGGGPLGDAV